MKIDINKFRLKNIIEFEETLKFNKEDLAKAEIIDIKNCNIKGTLKKYDEDLYEINLNVNGTMILECSISLEETEYNFNINLSRSFDLDGKTEENLKINGNMLDIFPFIWENIVLEKPLRIVKENNKGVTSGEGWSLTDETTIKENTQLNELSKILNMEEEK